MDMRRMRRAAPALLLPSGLGLEGLNSVVSMSASDSLRSLKLFFAAAAAAAEAGGAPAFLVGGGAGRLPAGRLAPAGCDLDTGGGIGSSSASAVAVPNQRKPSASVQGVVRQPNEGALVYIWPPTEKAHQ